MPPVYDDGESFTAGDDVATRFDNDRLVAFFLEVRPELNDHQLRVVRRAILRAIYGEAEER